MIDVEENRNIIPIQGFSISGSLSFFKNKSTYSLEPKIIKPVGKHNIIEMEGRSNNTVIIRLNMLIIVFFDSAIGLDIALCYNLFFNFDFEV